MSRKTTLAQPTLTPIPTKGRSVKEFRAAHDKNYIVPANIKQGLELLGPDGWEYELAFQKLAGVNNVDLARFREQFDAHVVNVGTMRDPRRVWAGSVGLAKKLREML